MNQICGAKRLDGTFCTNRAKTEYDYKYCGSHKSLFYAENSRKEVAKKLAPESEGGFYCGIDIGVVNLSISFLGFGVSKSGEISTVR